LTPLSHSEKDALITALLARIDDLVARVAALQAQTAALREKLNLPPKTPDNSSKPPSQGDKANAESKAKPKTRLMLGCATFQHAIDAGDNAFAPGIKSLLKRAIRIGRGRQTLAAATLVTYHARLLTSLDVLLKIVPATEPGHELQRIIKRFRQNLFVFVPNRDIPPTNNGSKQALRPRVVFRKVTNCFRSRWDADFYANVRSVIETARRRGVGIINAIRLPLSGNPLPTAGM
jgi:hypothetical protein